MRADPATPDSDKIQTIIQDHSHLEGPLLPILHALQAEYDHIPTLAHGAITDALNISTAELHGVVSFYHDFHSNPRGRHTIKLCRAEACQAVGANDLIHRVMAQFDLAADQPGNHATTSDQRITIEPVYCLGLCACGPAAMINGTVLGRATPETIAAQLAGDMS